MLSSQMSTRLLHELHVDKFSLLTPLSAGGEKYWALYTDDYSRYRGFDVTEAIAGRPHTISDSGSSTTSLWSSSAPTMTEISSTRTH
jgi:hypothetical protein